ncbi:MAG: ATPase, T2SS/T4P/T4SS family [Candidatus Sumerlaeota bacterium]|nr:ATPase, T2SS/T4P/T4SS family [Candidatus Sumerlaeota bacterium]
MMRAADSAKIGELLVEMGVVSLDDMDAAVAESKKSGERLGEILLKMNLVDEETLMQAIGRQLSVPYVRISTMKIDPAVIERVPAKLATHYELMPIRQVNGTLQIAVNDPLDIHLLDDLRLMLRAEIELAVASRKEIRDAIKRYYGIGADTMEGLVNQAEEAGEAAGPTVVENIEEMAEDASIVRFVNQIIMEAIHDRSTDIHFEPMEDELRIRYRIDGMLYEAAIPPAIKRFQSAILSRIKIMADMNIAERRLPQDGKIKLKSGDLDFDLRVSTVPTPYGESIAVRLLSRDSEFINLERLGLNKHDLGILRRMIRRPHGIILVTGPTGSGKSTTLYAALTEINDISKKIITIEEPIEYRIRGVTQIQVVPQIGLTFASCLRTILRQDPDIIMVGETRDTETAEITIRTALTGHLVFSTLHTNDACGAITRLLDMGIEPFLVSSSVEGMLAQRLVRVLCPDCKTLHEPSKEQLRMVNVTNDDPTNLKIYRQRGCEACRYTGFRGRTAIYEIVPISETLRRMIVERQPANILKQQAVREGMRPLRYDGWAKVKAGLTTIDEVLRVTIVEDEILIEGEGAEETTAAAPAAATKE